MASNRDDFTAIRTRFNALWPANVPVSHGFNGPNEKVPKTTWARLSIHPGDSDRPSIGQTKKYVQYGRIELQIFVPAQEGEMPAWDLAEIVTMIFRDWRSPDFRILCEQPEFFTMTSEREWFGVRCSIPYSAEH